MENKQSPHRRGIKGKQKARDIGLFRVVASKSHG